jgi:SNF2 family DNA or RNA helicase
VDKFLILSPNKFVQDWREEAKNKNAPIVPVVINTKDIRKGVLKKAKTGAFVINYEALAQKPVAKEIVEWCQGAMVIADESIWIKNPASKASREVLLMAKVAKYTRCLSGKPMTQGPHDLWAQLRFMYEANGMSPVVFKNNFCKMGGYMGKQVVGLNEEAQPRLQAMLDRCSWFATKLHWADIAAPDYAKRWIEMTPAQMRMYKKMEKEFLILLNDTLITADQVITQLLKLQQIASGFVYDGDRNVQWLDPNSPPNRATEIQYILENEIPENQKVVILAHYRPSIDLLMRILGKYNPAVIRDDKWHRDNERSVVAEKHRFNNDPNCRVIIGQIKATKYGHNLMGSKENPCLHTIFYENTYSLDDRSQCEERNRGVDQIGQTTIIDLVSNDRDYAIAQALERKESIFTAVMHR